MFYMWSWDRACLLLKVMTGSHVVNLDRDINDYFLTDSSETLPDTDTINSASITTLIK